MAQQAGFHNRVKDAHDRGMPELFDPSLFPPEENEGIIHFDFETIPMDGLNADRGKGRLEDVLDGNGNKTYNKKGKLVQEKVSGIAHDKQEPFELGLSVYNKELGRMVHKTFRFTPQGINGVAGDARRFDPVGKKGDGGDVEHAMGGQNAILKVDAKGGLHPVTKLPRNKYLDENVAAIKGLITPYVDGTEETVGEKVDWDGIDAFLEVNGVTVDQDTHFMAWNGMFDYPMLEKLLEHAGGMDTVFDKIYTKSSTINGEPVRYERHGEHLQMNDRTAGGRRHDGIVESARMWGYTAEGDDHKLVVLSDAISNGPTSIASPSDKGGKGFGKIGYYTDMERVGNIQPGGSGLGAWRHIIESRCFGSTKGGYEVGEEELDNPINDMFSSEEGREGFIERMGLDLDHVKHELISMYKEQDEYKPREWFKAVMEASAHSGVGDTAFMSELLLPMFGEYLEHFSPDAEHANGKDLRDKAAVFLRGWGDMIAEFPDREGKDFKAPIPLSNAVYGQNHFIDELAKGEGYVPEEPASGQLPLGAGGAPADDTSADDTPEDNPSDARPMVTRQQNQNTVPRLRAFGGDFQIGDVDYVKWEGPTSEKGIKERPVAIVTIGGVRVPFSASRRRWDEKKKEFVPTNQIQRWIPFSGAVNRYPYKDDEKVEETATGERMSEGIAQLFNSVLNKTYDEINGVLMDGAADIEAYLVTKPMLRHKDLNTRINTTASLLLNSTFESGKAVTYDESNSLLPLDGSPIGERRAELERILADEVAQFAVPGEDGQPSIQRSHEEMRGIFNILLASAHEGIGPDPKNPFPHLEAIDKETLGISQEWLNKSEQAALKQLIDEGFEINGTPITMEQGGLDDDEPIMTDETGGVSVNIDVLFNDYISGRVPVGTDVRQFKDIRSKRIEEGNWTGSLAQQLLGFIGCYTRINGLDMSPTEALEDVFDDVVPLDNNTPIPPQPEEPSEESSEEEVSGLADAWLVFGNPYEKEEDSWVLQNASPKALENARARWSVYNWEQENPDGTAAQQKEWEAQQIRLQGSPFIDEWQIKSALAQATKQEAFDEIFPQRELAENEEGVSQLINDAIETYGENSKLPSASILVRELEWIRANHPEHFTKEILAEVLNVDESVAMERVAGRWMAAVNMGYGAMGDKAQEEMALIEQERVHMGDDRFMGSAHREFLREQLGASGETDWAPVEEPTTPSQQIMEESDEPLISWGDLARQMAVGTAKSPVNALKYLTNWNQISTQAKDAVSGRTDAGKKLMEAAAKDEDLFRVNIGTEEEPKFISRISDFNYYTGNLPIKGDEQRGFLARFLSGPKTFDDLREEEDKPDYKTRQKNIGTALDRLHDYTEQEVRNRFKPTPTTDEEQQAAAGVQGAQVQDQNQWESGVARGLEGQINPPPPPEEPKGIIPRTQYNPETGQHDPVEKSLDRLREYLLRV